MNSSADRHLPNLKAAWGFKALRPFQRAVVECMELRRDIMAVAPTAEGKSLCYQLPALAAPGVTLVISPTIALIEDQVEGLQNLGVPVARLHSESPDEVQAVQDAKLLYTTPERLASPMLQRALAHRGLSFVAVDEAHCVSLWGHNFRPSYLLISRQLDAIDRMCGRRAPRTAFTATASRRTQADIIRQLGLVDCATIMRQSIRDNISLTVTPCSDDRRKIEELTQILEQPRNGDSVIVYCATTKTVDALHSAFDERCSAARYHGRMPADDKEAARAQFTTGEADVMFATNAFGLGVDVASLCKVVHYDMPGRPESYIQEVGRAGRTGRPAQAILLYGPDESDLQRMFIEQRCPPAQDVRKVWSALVETGAATAAVFGSDRKAKGKLQSALGHLSAVGAVRLTPQGDVASVHPEVDLKLKDLQERRRLEYQALQDMTDYAENEDASACRHAQLTTLLTGEDKPSACGVCDHCSAKYLAFCSSRSARRTSVLQRYLTPQTFKDRHSQAVEAGWLERRRNTVALSETGRLILRALQHANPAAGLPAPAKDEPAPPPADAACIARLRAMRRTVALDYGVEASSVLSEQDIRNLSAAKPQSAEELIACIGAEKAADHAASILPILGAPFDAAAFYSDESDASHSFDENVHTI